MRSGRSISDALRGVRNHLAAATLGHELLLSGWINGADLIGGHGGLAVARLGGGRVVLFGFRPQYRGQTIATYPLIFNALKQAIISDGPSSKDGPAAASSTHR